jgi:hypothetical protein
MPTPFAVVPGGASPERPLVATGSFELSAQLADLPRTLIVRPWPDTVIETVGYDPRSMYAEMFWLSVIGPTALWLVRRLVAGLEHFPDGYELDLGETARALGLGYTAGKAGPFLKALDRCGLFGLTRPASDGLAVRRKLAPLPRRHVDKMPPHLQAAHADWAPHRQQPDELALARATAIARVLLSAGDEPEIAEHHLLALGVAPQLAALALARCEPFPDEARPA